MSGCRLLTYLRDVLGRVADYPINRIAELLPWNVAVGFAPGDEIAFLFLVFFPFSLSLPHAEAHHSPLRPPCSAYGGRQPASPASHVLGPG